MSKLVSIPDDGFVKVPIMVPDIDTPIGYRYVNLGFMPAVENNQGPVVNGDSPRAREPIARCAAKAPHWA